MKSKFKIAYRLAPCETVPGKLVIQTQWSDGGATTSDNNNGRGWTEDEALREITRRRTGSFKAAAPEIITPKHYPK